MRPRNKFQAEVVALSKRLPKITATQQRWAEKNCFEHYARKTKQGVISCLECGKEWTDKHLTAEKTVCPHCGMELTVKETRAFKFKQVEYLCIVTKCANFQVLRFFYIESNTRKGEPAYYYCREVVQRWIAPNGKFATMAMLRPLFGFADYWQWSSELEIRPEKELYNIMPRLRRKSRYCQYDYHHTDGTLFSTVAPTLEKCREKRDIWLVEKQQ